MSTASSSGTGIGFLGLLTIVLVILRATETIDWSWWWVFAPLWIPWAIFFGVALIVGIVSLIALAVVHFEEKRYYRRNLARRERLLASKADRVLPRKE